MEEQQPINDNAVTPSHNPKPFKHHLMWMYVVLTAAAFAAVAGTGAGVYYLQQGQIDSLSAAISNMQLTQKAAVADKTFAEKQSPFTFTYPGDWTKVYDKPIQSDTPQANYNITLMSPGTVVNNELIGSDTVKEGARINISVSDAKFTTIDQWLADSFTGKTLTKAPKDVKVAGVSAKQYNFAYESQEQVYTTFVKDGKMYDITFVGGDGLEKSTHYSAYTDLLVSFKFK